MSGHKAHSVFKDLSDRLGSHERRKKRLKEADVINTSNDGLLTVPAAPQRRGIISPQTESQTDDELLLDQASEASSLAPSNDEILGTEPEAPFDLGTAGTSFWERAYQELKNDLDLKTKSLMEDYDDCLEDSRKQSLEGEDEGGESIGETLDREGEMKALVSKKMKQMQKKEWIVKWRGKEVFHVRKAVTETVKVVQKFSGLASNAASLDPLHAGIAWAGVACILPLIINDTTERTKAIDGVSSTAQITARYLLIERDYRKGLLGQQKDTKFEESVINLCKEILKFYAKSAIFFARSSWTQWLRSSCTIDDWSAALKSITDADKLCQDFTTVVTSSVLLEGRQDIAKLLDAHEEDKMHAMVGWVSKTEVGEQHKQVKEKLGTKYANSGQWLLTSPSFLAWTERSQKHFWLRGAVGTGKSSLVSIIIERLREKEENVAFFYCTRALGDPDVFELPQTTIIRALAGQLAKSPDKKSVAEEVKIEYENAVSLDRAASELGYNQAMALLSGLISSRDSVTIVIDALDECPDYRELLVALKTIAGNNNNLKLLLSSQLVVSVTDFFSSEGVTIDRCDNFSDITDFVKGEIGKFEAIRSKALPEKLSEDIVSTLSGKAGGMFKWAELNMKFLLGDEERANEIRTNLEIIKKEPYQGALMQLVEAYERLYNKYLPSHPTKRAAVKQKAEKVLSWIFVSTRPLHLHEVLCLENDSYIENTSHETSDQSIMKVCRSFIFESNTHVIEMSHSSVSDYLAIKFAGKVKVVLTNKEGEMDQKQILEDAYNESKLLKNLRVARESISYILSTKSICFGPDHPIDQKSILPYMAESWFKHAKRAIRRSSKVQTEEDLDETPESLRVSIRLLFNTQNQQAFDNWLSIHDPDIIVHKRSKNSSATRERGQQLYYALLLGFWKFAREMMDGGWDVNATGGVFGTCLQCASYNGSTLTVTKLLEKGASPNTDAGIFGSALQAAAAGGHTFVCSLLISHDADVNSKGGLLCSPLQAALARGSLDTIKLFMPVDSWRHPTANYWTQAYFKLNNDEQEQFKNYFCQSAAVDMPAGLTLNQEILASTVALTRKCKLEARKKKGREESGSLSGESNSLLAEYARYKILHGDEECMGYIYTQIPWISLYLALKKIDLSVSGHQVIDKGVKTTLRIAKKNEEVFERFKLDLVDTLPQTIPTTLFHAILKFELIALRILAKTNGMRKSSYALRTLLSFRLNPRLKEALRRVEWMDEHIKQLMYPAVEKIKAQNVAGDYIHSPSTPELLTREDGAQHPENITENNGLMRDAETQREELEASGERIPIAKESSTEDAESGEEETSSQHEEVRASKPHEPQHESQDEWKSMKSNLHNSKVSSGDVNLKDEIRELRREMAEFKTEFREMKDLLKALLKEKGVPTPATKEELDEGGLGSAE